MQPTLVDRHRTHTRAARAARRLTISAVLLAAVAPGLQLAAQTRPYPIMFATQVPIPGDFTAIGSVFGNHEGDIDTVGRGGDLYVLYPNNTLRNLTLEAGFGIAGSSQVGAEAIAVREPCVHWSGTKAVFSMVRGAPASLFDYTTFYWQLYEVTNFDQPTGQTASITLVPNQPAGYNNVSPCYGSDDRIIFTSDRPHNGAAHLYPQLDEYEEAETVSGLFSLDPATGDLLLLDHAPSGDFTPIVDSFGRVIFSRWDHLQRDQQADADYAAEQEGDPPPYGTFNYSGEHPGSVPTASRAEIFPEARASRPDQLPPGVLGHSFNHFFPWMVNQDGSELETLNHIGRHELHTYFNRAFGNGLDPNQTEFICGGNSCGRFNENDLLNLLQMREQPTEVNGVLAGTYFGIDAPEFYTHASGQILSLRAEPSRSADQIAVTWVTHPETKGFDNGANPDPCHSGLYRNPLPLSDAAGTIVAVHAGERSPGVPETRQAANEGTRALPVARYKLRMVTMQPDGGACAGYLKYGAPLLPTGIQRTIQYFDPDVQVTYNNVRMWELYPVEVRPRPVPTNTGEPALQAPEAAVFTAEQVDVEEFRDYLRQRDLALIVSRNVTTRDAADRQQPFLLRVPGGVQTTPNSPTTPVFDVDRLEVYQADLIRGLGGTVNPRAGRRVLAQPMHGLPANENPDFPGAPAHAVELGLDGSMAALVPAHRALSWHLASPSNTPVVRERYWLTFQPGEIRVCASCHGLNSQDQDGATVPTNQPAALAALLQHWKDAGPLFYDGFESGDESAWSSATP